MKDGRELVIDQLILFQLFGDETFYGTLPPGFDDLADKGREAYKQAVALALGQANCTGCSTLKGVITPVQNELGRRMAAVQAVQPMAFTSLAQLIAQKRGYRPRPVTFYFKDETGRTQRLSF